MDTLLRLTAEKEEKVRQEQNDIHSGKLAKLGIFEQVNTKYVNKRERGIEKRVEMADQIFNLSTREL